MQSLRSNLNRGEPRVRIVEIGRCFAGDSADLSVQPEKIAGIAFGSARPEQWSAKDGAADFFDAKGDLEVLAGVPLQFEAATHAACHPGRCAAV